VAEEARIIPGVLLLVALVETAAAGRAGMAMVEVFHM
jgi:hypothetical protein